MGWLKLEWGRSRLGEASGGWIGTDSKMRGGGGENRRWAGRVKYYPELPKYNL